jgi:hypothetical protein
VTDGGDADDEDYGDDDDVISLYYWNPERFQRVNFIRSSINCSSK